MLKHNFQKEAMPTVKEPKGIFKYLYSSPYWLVAVITIAVFATECLVLALLSFFPEPSARVAVLIDSIILILFILPCLNYFLFRPLTLHIAEHKRAEEALRKSENSLREAQRIAHIGNWDLDLVHNVLTWSDEIYRIFEIDPQKFGASYEAFLDTVHPDDRMTVDRAYTESVKNRAPYDIVHRLLMKDGRIKYANERCETFYDDAGRPLRSIGTVLDITRHKQAEEEISKLNIELEERVVERTAQLATVLDESQQRQTEITALLSGSRAVLEQRDFAGAARIIFTTCKELIGAASGYIALLEEGKVEYEIVFLDPGERPCEVAPTRPMPIRGLRAEVYRTGKAVWHNDFAGSEWVGLMPEGHMRMDNVLFAPLVMEGKGVGILGLANKPGGFIERDAQMASAFGELAAIALTNSRARESLENSEERFRSVAQSALDAVISVDYQGKIIFWNEAASRIFGHDSAEVIGQPLTTIMPERFRSAHQGGLERVVATGETRMIGKLLEMEGRRKDGSEFPVELSLSRWKTREGTFFTGIVRDITDRRKAAQEISVLTQDLNLRAAMLEETNVRLNEVNHLKSMFIASMSHELRTPLNSIIGFSSIILNEWLGPLNAEQKENLSTVLRAGRHLLFLINDVIDVSKIEAGMIEPFIEEFDVFDLIAEAVRTMENEMLDKGLELRLENTNQQLCTDRRRLLQCVLNLLSNAIKFTEKGYVQLRVERVAAGARETAPEEMVEISVADSGIGIREEDIPALFTPFTRIDSPLKSRVPGTGLGLYLSRKLAMEVLHGEMTAESRQGEGSRFALLIPVRSGE